MPRDEVLKILGQPADDNSYPTIFCGDEGHALVWISPEDDCVFDAKWTPRRASVSAEATGNGFKANGMVIDDEETSHDRLRFANRNCWRRNCFGVDVA